MRFASPTKKEEVETSDDQRATTPPRTQPSNTRAPTCDAMLRIAGRQAGCRPFCRPSVSGPQRRHRSAAKSPQRAEKDRTVSQGHGKGENAANSMASVQMAAKARVRAHAQFLSAKFMDGLRSGSTVRESLRQWEEENYQPNTYESYMSLLPGQIANSIYKSEALSGVREGRQHEEVEDGIAVDEMGAAESLPVAPKEHLLPGTLIELRCVVRPRACPCHSIRR